MLRWRRVSRFLDILATRWNEHDCFMRSAALAYSAAFSLFPLCLVLLAGLGAAAKFSAVLQLGQSDLLDAIESGTSPWLAQQLEQLLTSIKVKAGIGGPVGLGMLLLAAASFFLQLENSLDRIWGYEASGGKSIAGMLRLLLRDRLSAFLMLLGVGLVLIALLGANLALSAVESRVQSWWMGALVLQCLHFLVTPLIYTIVFTAIYKFLPKSSIRWSHAIEGGGLVAAIWWIGQNVLQNFVIADHYTIYGVVGSFIAILVWTYYGSMAMLGGAEFVKLANDWGNEK